MEPGTIAVIAIVALATAVGGFLIGRRGRSAGFAKATTRRRLEEYGQLLKKQGKSAAFATTTQLRRLEEYPFYPFVVNYDGHVEFDADLFTEAVRHLRKEWNERAATELIVIGEQNLVRNTFPTDTLNEYKLLYEEYDGDNIITDNEEFLDNYKRIVNQLGRSFRNTGIEILLHNLVNPTHSLVAIENGEVTGRSVGSGATNLVLDLRPAASGARTRSITS